MLERLQPTKTSEGTETERKYSLNTFRRNSTLIVQSKRKKDFKEYRQELLLKSPRVREYELKRCMRERDALAERLSQRKALLRDLNVELESIKRDKDLLNLF